MSLVLDAGALLAIDRRDRRVGAVLSGRPSTALLMGSG